MNYSITEHNCFKNGSKRVFNSSLDKISKNDAKFVIDSSFFKDDFDKNDKYRIEIMLIQS